MDTKELLSHIYIVEYFKRLFRKGNTGIIIFLVLNLTLYIALFGGFQTPVMIPMAVTLYLISITIALSPIGEFIVRIQAGCKSIKRIAKKNPQVEQRLVPLFETVYEKAKIADPTISDKVKMFVSLDKDPNAFATGRKTVCVTRGLLQYSDEQIEAVLAHEFGHISHKDTDTLLVILVSNLLLSILFFLYRVFVNLVVALVGVGDKGYVSIGNVITSILIDFLLVMVIRLWTKIGVLLCLHSSRQNEYEADRFACQLGYQNELYSALQDICGEEIKSGFFASISSSHPDTSLRLEKIAEFDGTIADVQSSETSIPMRGKEQISQILTYAAKKTEAVAAAFPAKQKVFYANEYVYAKYSKDGYHYLGEISGLSGKQADFIFYLGIQEAVDVKNLVRIEEVEPEKKVEANWQKQGTYYPCVIKACEDTHFIVEYLDGRREEMELQDIRF